MKTILSLFDYTGNWSRPYRENGSTEKSKQLVYKTLEIIDYFEPHFWVIENPMSRIHKCCPELGQVKFKFNPTDFAGYCKGEEQEKNRYNKQMWLWVNFNNPIPKPLESTLTGRQFVDKSKKRGIELQNARSATPMRIRKSVLRSK